MNLPTIYPFVALAGAGIVAIISAALCFRVAIAYLRAGYTTVDDARSRGMSIKAWIDPAFGYDEEGSTGQARASRRAVFKKGIGWVMSEERAPTHVYGQR